MPKEHMLFCGYGSFKAKDSDKIYFMLKFLTPIKTRVDRDSADCKQISVFTSKEQYNAFRNKHKLMDFTDVVYDVDGDKVYYSLPE